LAFQPDYAWDDEDDTQGHSRATVRWTLLAHAWQEECRGVAAAAVARRKLDSEEKNGPGSWRNPRRRRRSEMVAPDGPTSTNEKLDSNNRWQGASRDSGGRWQEAANSVGSKLSPIGIGDRISPIHTAGVGGSGGGVCEAELGFAGGDGSFDLAGSEPPRLRLAPISETSDGSR
jgi:hypothetical protein